MTSRFTTRAALILGVARVPFVALALIIGIYLASSIDQVDAEQLRAGPTAMLFEASPATESEDTASLREALLPLLRRGGAVILLRPSAEGLGLAVHDPENRWVAGRTPLTREQQIGTDRVVSARSGSLLAALDANGLRVTLAADAVAPAYEPHTVPVTADYVTNLLGAQSLAGRWAIIGSDTEVAAITAVLLGQGLSLEPVASRSDLQTVLLTPLGTLLMLTVGLALLSTTSFWVTHLRQLAQRIRIHRTWGASTADAVLAHLPIVATAWVLALALGSVVAALVAAATRMPLGPAFSATGLAMIIACVLGDAVIAGMTHILTVAALGRRVHP